MPKITYVLTLFGHGKHPSPVPVCGWLHPAPFGYAEYDPAINTHVLRVSQEAWEGEIAADLAQKIRTHMDQWIITAEVEPDLESPEGKHAQEVDALKAEIARLEQALAAPIPSAQARADGITPAEPTPPAASPANSPAVPPPDFSEMGLEDLETALAMASAAGAKIEITGYRTKVKLRAALTDYYTAK